MGPSFPKQCERLHIVNFLTLPVLYTFTAEIAGYAAKHFFTAFTFQNKCYAHTFFAFYL